MFKEVTKVGEFKMIVFDVAHGSCVFFKTPKGYTMLIDCGSSTNFSAIKYIKDCELEGTIKHKGYNLTKLVVTHPHADHIQDIERLDTYLRPYLLMRQKYDWEAVREEARSDETPELDYYIEFQDGYGGTPSAEELPDWDIDISHFYFTPRQAEEISSTDWINNSSILTVVSVEAGGQTWKFTVAGDLMKNGWEKLLERSDVQKAIKGTSFFITSHHGHSSGYSPKIFEYMGRPYFNIASVQARDTSVEPAYSREENAIGVDYNGETRRLFTTRKDGSIIITVDTNTGKCTFWCSHFEDNI